ncbi:MAG: hypothetical protein IIW69_08100 [Bacteroidaceae bacterium]|nr:hypothetical protein [Bacteroidaceae bacterium]
MLLIENAEFLLDAHHEGFGIETDNCQEAYEFLEGNGYVDFDDNGEPRSRFILTQGIHYVERNGHYRTGHITWPNHDSRYGSDHWLPISFEDFVAACDNGGETFNNKISLEDLL